MIEEEQKLLNEAQKSGVEITPEAAAGIRSMAEEFVYAEEKLRDLREQQEEFARRQGEIKGSMKGSFSDLARGAEGLSDALGNVIDKLIEMALSTAFESLWTSFGGDGLTAILAGLPSFSGSGWTGSAPRSGGLDGEGGFLALMHPQESVNDHTRPGSGAGPIDVHVTVGVDPRNGSIVPYVDRRVDRRVTQSDQQFPSRWAAVQREKSQRYD